MGKTPLKNVRVPRGTLIWKLEKPGFGHGLPHDALVDSSLLGAARRTGGKQRYTRRTGQDSAGMVRVETAKYFKTLFIPGYEGMPELPLKDYWIDRTRSYQPAVQSVCGPGWIPEARLLESRLRARRQATLLRRDYGACSAMPPGAQGLKIGYKAEYPKGQDDFPVTGISWYEAAAFAEFAGKSLPTIYHWNRAAGPFSASFIVPASNFGSTGILPGRKQAGHESMGKLRHGRQRKGVGLERSGSGQALCFGRGVG